MFAIDMEGGLEREANPAFVMVQRATVTKNINIKEPVGQERPV